MRKEECNFGHNQHSVFLNSCEQTLLQIEAFLQCLLGKHLGKKISWLELFFLKVPAPIIT